MPINLIVMKNLQGAYVQRGTPRAESMRARDSQTLPALETGSTSRLAGVADGRRGTQDRRCLLGDTKTRTPTETTNKLQSQRLKQEDSSFPIAADFQQGTVGSQRSHHIGETKQMHAQNKPSTIPKLSTTAGGNGDENHLM